MDAKCIEIRDEGTCISALALRMIADDPVEEAFLRRSGYSSTGNAIVLLRLDDQKATVDPYLWYPMGLGGRTMQIAHDYLDKFWPTIVHGQVVDVRVILKEATERAEPEIYRHA